MKDKIVNIILIIVLSLIQGFAIATAIFTKLTGLEILMLVFITIHYIIYGFVLIWDLLGGLKK